MLRAQTRRLHRARLGAVRRLLPDLRRLLVQPATRGARMGAISARQAITRSTPKRRARVRPRQPARPTAIARRTLTTQAAASFTSTWAVGSSSTPTRSAPAPPARSCCAPVRPVLARPAEAPQGAIGLLTLTGYHGYHGVLQGNHGVLTGSRGTIQSHKYVAWELKEALEAAHGWMDAEYLSAWARELLRRHARSALGTPPSAGVHIGYSRPAIGWACIAYCTRPRVALIYGRCRKNMFLPTCTHAACQ